jgi:hypothetical protein
MSALNCFQSPIFKYFCIHRADIIYSKINNTSEPNAQRSPRAAQTQPFGFTPNRNMAAMRWSAELGSYTASGG